MGTCVEAFEAAKQLANREGDGVVNKLARVLGSAKIAHSREAAAYALAWHSSKSAIPHLFKCAANTQEIDNVRGEAIEGLGIHLDSTSRRNKDRVKAEDLMISLLLSQSPVLRFWSCFALGSLGCKRAIPHLTKVMKEDREVYPGWWYVAEEAEDALERIAGRSGADRIPVHFRKQKSLRRSRKD